MLKNNNFKFRYSTGRKDLPIDFCELALSNSCFFDLGLGYFSTASFNVLSTGFARFISCGGNMRLYINQFLTSDDYKLIQNDERIDFDERITQSFLSLKKTLSNRDEQFFQCLSFLIINKRIEIRIVVPKNGGLAHEKFGIFRDENNDKVAFTGSMNFTAAALLRNIETVECTCSWKNEDNLQRIEQSEREFSEIWDGTSNLVSVFPANHFCKEILKTYPLPEINELLIQENEIIKKLSQEREKEEINVTLNKTIIVKPHFPSKYKDGPRLYQKEAYQKWLENDKKGIFAMATGTGKTVTSLNCVLQEYLISCSDIDKAFYQILILVPTIALVDQWIEEVTNFDFNNIFTVYSQNSKWRKEMVSLKNRIIRGKRKMESFVIISTYQSFVNDDFQKILSQLPDNMILIADEAHNIGSESVKDIFKNLKIKNRIALSATPNRIYDKDGTIEIETFFNDKPPYVYNFSMEMAIKERFLVEYCYYPKIVYLDNSEMKKYAEYTKELIKLYDSESGKYKDEQKALRFLMLRKQVLHKAEDKYRVLLNIINEIGNDFLKYCFIYVPEGKENRDEDELSFNDEESEEIIQKMLETIKLNNPKTTCNIYTGKVNKTERKAILTGFAKGDIDVLLAMKCLDEGVDIPRAQIGIFASSTGNPRQFIQRRGRLLRRFEGKTFAYIYDMIVVPNFMSEYYSKQFYNIERGLVKGELSRVSYFASLATNTHEALNRLEEISKHYDLDISDLILNVTQ